MADRPVEHVTRSVFPFVFELIVLAPVERDVEFDPILVRVSGPYTRE